MALAWYHTFLIYYYDTLSFIVIFNSCCMHYEIWMHHVYIYTHIIYTNMYIYIFILYIYIYIRRICWYYDWSSILPSYLICAFFRFRRSMKALAASTSYGELWERWRRSWESGSDALSFPCSKKIPTDPWNIPQTLKHLFMKELSYLDFGIFGMFLGCVGIFLDLFFPSSRTSSYQLSTPEN